MKIKYRFTTVAKMLSLVMILYIMLPLIFTILFSFSKNIEVIPSELTLHWYMFNIDTMLESMRNTLIISVPSVLIAVLVSFPMAFAIARSNFRGKKFIEQVIILPTIIPGTVLGLAFLQIANTGIFSTIPPLMILIFAHVVVTIPVIAKPIIAALEQMGTEPEEAAKTLGASSFKVFWTVTFPIISSGVVVGMILGLARSITDFIMTLFIVPPGYLPMSIQIFNSTQYSIPQITSANAVILLIFTIIIVSVSERILKHRR